MYHLRHLAAAGRCASLSFNSTASAAACNIAPHRSTAVQGACRFVSTPTAGVDPADEAEHLREPTPWEKRGKRPVWQPGLYSVPPAPVVPPGVPRPSYADDPDGRPGPLEQDEYGEVKSAVAIAKMRRSCGLAAEALELAREVAQEGTTTDEVDRAVGEFVISRGAYPVGINYYGFPRCLCASPNEVALHGVPNTRPLEAGDIINFDVTVFLDGHYGDCSAMVCIGEVDAEARRLVNVTQECLHATMAEVGPGVKLNSLGRFSRDFGVARGFGVVAEYCGHFIGRELHMRPNVLHVPNPNTLVLRPGMTFTIEPILVEGGSAEISGPLEDGWTIISKSGGWSAQWEHTVLVTEHGVEALTLPL